MNLEEYERQFEDILDGQNQSYPYDNDDYLNYVKMNKARIRRWTKSGKILPELEERIKSEKKAVNWLLITEPWCGDAAHSHPFIGKLSALNSAISLTVQNRDSSGSVIENYLTNGSRSIPILVVRDNDNNDLFTWGPRPSDIQTIVIDHKKNPQIDNEEHKKDVQKWYNKDKGKSLQHELLEAFNTIV